MRPIRPKLYRPYGPFSELRPIQLSTWLCSLVFFLGEKGERQSREMGKEALDYVLVPLGLALMVGYHAWLLLRIRRRPATTVIGVNSINRRIWVRHIMEVCPPLTHHLFLPASDRSPYLAYPLGAIAFSGDS
jgi:hypothetical protein